MCWVFSSSLSWGQEHPPQRVDSIPGFINDSIRINPLVKPPQEVNDMRRTNKKILRDLKSEQFYDSLYRKSQRNLFTKTLYDLIFKSGQNPSGKMKLDSVISIESEKPFAPYEDLIINNIRIKTLNIYGGSVTDTTYTPLSWFEKTVNSLHVTTKSFTIKQNLLFKPGDYVNAVKLSNNERLLRQLPFIHDARIYIEPVKDCPNEVNILVITQDNWSILPGGSVNGRTRFRVSLNEKNLAGLGHQFKNTAFYDEERDQMWGYEGDYYVNNILGTFIDGRVTYNNRWDRKGIISNIERPFIVNEISNVGQAKFEHQTRVNDFYFYEKDTTYDDLTYDYLETDFWYGHSFGIIQSSLKNPTQLMISARTKYRTYHTRPEGVSADSLYYFHDSRIYLFSINFLRSNFIKGTRIYGYGRTEDVPYGFQLTFTSGYQFQEYDLNRPYTGFLFSRSLYQPNKGYLYYSFAIGTFWNNGQMQDGVFSFNNRLFSKYIKWRKYGIRHFFNLNYTYGINQLGEASITINRDQNLGGIKTSNRAGIQRLTVNYETVLFSPSTYAGFQFALFSFADLAVLADRFPMRISPEAYLGLGFGARLVNEKLIFSNFEIKLAYYPVIPKDERSFIADLDSYPEPRFDNFTEVKPRVVPFR
ncbi:hypothetical protein AUTU_25920 [Aureibacter tunicatorum]|nr:hypothetical protein AUTU_25920 [Aureibacter tunicatorum]